jgi:tetratricopeptide (TPR) repeat protein
MERDTASGNGNAGDDRDERPPKKEKIYKSGSFASKKKKSAELIRVYKASLRKSFSKLLIQLQQLPAKTARALGSKKDAPQEEPAVMFLDDLPPEVLSNILLFLPVAELVRGRPFICVCYNEPLWINVYLSDGRNVSIVQCKSAALSKRWHKLASSGTLWREMYKRDFLVSSPPSNIKTKNWRAMYIHAATQLREANVHVRNKPHDCESYVTRALVHIELKHHQAAVLDLSTAIQLKVGDRKAKNRDISHGGLLLRRASIYRKMQQADAARQDADAGIKLEPDNASYYRIRGNWAREDGDFTQALGDFDAAITLDPSNAMYHFCKGLVLKETKDYRGAIRHLDDAIALEPSNGEYYCSRGRLYSHLGELDAALADLNKAVELDPQNSDYLHWRGRIRRDRQECVEAMRDFEAALRITGDDIDYAWRGIMHSHMKNNLAAIEDIDRAIALAPTNSFHFQFRGIIHFGLENLDAAKTNFSKAIELLPDWAGHYVWRAAIYSEKRDLPHALRDLDKAVRLRADEVSLFWRGLSYLDMGETTKALYDLEGAHKSAMLPVHSRIVFWRGVAHALLGESDTAERFYDETLRLANAECKVARYAEPARVYLLRQQGKKKARDLYRQLFDSFYTIDNAKTEQSHLELLSRLFPTNAAVRKTLSWFERTRKTIFLPSVMQRPSSPPSSSKTDFGMDKPSSANKDR